MNVQNFLLNGVKFNNQERDQELMRKLKQQTRPSEFISIQSSQAQKVNTKDFNKISQQEEKEYQQQNGMNLVDYDHITLKSFDEIQVRYKKNLSKGDMKQLLSNIHDKLLWKSPSLCQQAAIPSIISKTDSVILSPTGSGKTGAFLIPAIIMQLKTVVLVPTLELQQQIEQVLKMLTFQLHDFQQQQIVVMNTNTLNIESIQTLDLIILDECDQLINNNYDKLQKFLNTFQSSAKAVFSATLNDKLFYLTQEFLQNPATLTIQKRNQATTNINHEFLFISDITHKPFVLKQLLFSVKPPVIVFFQNVDQLLIVHKQVSQKFSISVVHEWQDETLRTQQLQLFKTQKTWILLTTDLLSRGIDFFDIQAVIQYEVPTFIEQYVHRSGRAGRQQYGRCITFYTAEQKDIVTKIQNNIDKKSKQ